jgi:hypothetical protein
MERTVASLVVLGTCDGGRKKKKEVFRRERECGRMVMLLFTMVG